MSRPFPALLALLALPLTLFTAAPAVAATLDNAAAGLHLTLDTPGARVCVVLPVASRSPVGCEGIDVDQAAAQLQKGAQKISGFATIRFADWSLLVTLKSDLGVAVRTREDIESFLGGMKNSGGGAGLSANKIRIHGDAPGTGYDLGRANDVNYLRTHLDFLVSPDEPLYNGSRTLLYLLDGKDGSQMLMFSTGPEHAAEAQTVAEAIVHTVALPPSRSDAFGKSKSYLLGKAIGTALPVVALLIFLGVKAWQSRKKGAVQR